MAADPGIVSYIREQMDAGFRKAQIYEALLQAGWYKEEIDEAFYSIAGEIYGRPEPMVPTPVSQARTAVQEKQLPKSPGFFWKLTNSLFHPGRFFDAVKNEKDIGNSLSFYGLLYFIHLVFFISFYLMEAYLEADLMSATAMQSLSALIPIIALQGVLILFFGYLLMLAVPFLAALVVHLFAYLMGGRKGFHSTFKSVSYSLAPTILVWPMALVFNFLPETIIQADIRSIIYQILLLALCILVLYLLIRGIKRFHEISGLRAFLSVFIPLAIAILILVALVLSPLTAFFINLGSFANATQSQGLAIIDFDYKADGSFSLALRDLQGSVIVNTVSAGCSENGAYIDLDTTGYTRLEPGDSIQYYTGSNKCLAKETGEKYSVMVNVRYMDSENSPNNFYKSVEGNVS